MHLFHYTPVPQTRARFGNVVAPREIPQVRGFFFSSRADSGTFAGLVANGSRNGQ
jgi:hypothetical protein